MKLLSRPGPRRIKRLWLGYFFFTCGVLFGALPFVQGWLLFALGLFFLKNDVRWAHKVIVWTKHKIPRARPAFNRMEWEFDRWLEKFDLKDTESNAPKEGN